MRRESNPRSRLPLVLLFVLPAPAIADSKSDVPIVVDAVVFKENGRFDPKIIEACEIDRDLREAMEELNPKRRRGSSENPEPLRVTLRIDRVGRLGSQGRAGTEISVTAIPGGSNAGRLFLCRDQLNFMLPVRPGHCDRITFCAREIASDVVSWLSAQKDR